MGKHCALCKTKENLTKHHYIPQKILKEYGMSTNQFIMRLCVSCHARIHEFPIEHLHIQHFHKPLSKFAGYKWHILKRWLKHHHPTVLKEYNEYFREFIMEHTEACVTEVQQHEQK